MSVARRLNSAGARLVARHASSRLLRAAYDVTLTAELAAVRVADWAAGRAGEDAACAQLTMVVKTFERPRAVRRLVRSARRLFPELRIVVVDDSREPVEIAGVDWLQLPYDSGVSAGRKAGLARVTTPYTLLVDDDFVFCAGTRIDRLIGALDRNSMLDIVAGRVLDLPLFSTNEAVGGPLYDTERRSLVAPGTVVDGLHVYDKVPNFFVARTERLRLVDWDPEVKRLDHAEFFTRAKGVLVSALDATVYCLHARTPFDLQYMAKRRDCAADAEYIGLKFALERAAAADAAGHSGFRR